MADDPERSSNAAATNLAQAIRMHESFVLRRQGGKRADLRFAKLQWVKLVNRRLDEIEFSGADLTAADLSHSILDRAVLYCSNLSHASLIGASIRRADLRGAKLKGTNFDFANLEGADFRQATIASVSSAGENSPWKVAGGENDNGTVSFINCSMKGAKLDNANLKDAKFDGAILTDATFAGTTLGNASFEGAVLLGVNIEHLRVAKDRLKSCVIDPNPEIRERLPEFMSRLQESELWVSSGGRQGRIADFSGEDIRLLAPMMNSRKLTGIVLRNTLAVGVDLSGCEAQCSNFEGADLRDARFVRADLRGTSFRGANLAHADFTQADLSDLVLQSGQSIKTVFEGAILDGAKFDDRAVISASNRPSVANQAR